MKTTNYDTTQSDQWPAFAGLRHNRRVTHVETGAMLSSGSIANRQSSIENESAFTIVELLTVIAIIGILAAILLPALSAAKAHAMKTQARLQAQDIVTAIQNYDSAYSRFPVSKGVQQAAGGDEFTYGGSVLAPFTPGTIPAIFTTNNSEVIAILMDFTNYPDGSGPTANVNYQKNPQQTVFLNAKMAIDTNSAGVGPDLVYRDPWGNPYVISMDFDEDNQVQDAFYRRHTVSQQNGPTGYNGLVNTKDPAGNTDDFSYHGDVMVWSAGPDKTVDPTKAADQGANLDNILSWQ